MANLGGYLLQFFFVRPIVIIPLLAALLMPVRLNLFDEETIATRRILALV